MSIPADPRFFSMTRERRAARRAGLFRETPLATVRRWTLGTAWALQPSQIGGLPALSGEWLRNLVTPAQGLPDPRHSLNGAGLCGIANDLSVPTLIEGYRRGLYPWCHLGPSKWLSPPERCVLALDAFHLSKRLRSRLRQARYRVTFDRDFEGVIKACAEPREGKWRLTWITPRVMRAYSDLHDAGYAHSFEVWNPSGELVGGGYGVAVGGAFVVESQFARESHTSKIGFAVLNWHLARWGFVLNDNKVPARHCLEAGFRMIPRAEFLARLEAAQLLKDKTGVWQVETDLPAVADWQPDAAAAAETVQAEARELHAAASTAKPSRSRMWLPLLPAVDPATIGFTEALVAII